MINEKARPYRRSRQFKEIGDYFSQSKGDKESIVWQNLNGNRCVYSSSHFTLNKQYKTLMFIMQAGAGFDLSEPIYVRFEDGLMFKTKALNMIEECLTLKLPEEFMAYELRDFARVRFKASDDEFAHILIESDFLNKASQELSFQIIDFSEMGIALNLSDIHLKKFLDSKRIVLKKLFSVSLAHEVEMDFMYSKKIRFKKDGEIYTSNRCGFKLKNALEPYLLQLHGH